MMRRMIDLLIHKLLILFMGKDLLKFLISFLHVQHSFGTCVANRAFLSKLEMHAV